LETSSLRAVAALLGLAWLAGCAPTTMSPMVIRLGPGNPTESFLQAGLRSGPRLSAPLSVRTNPDPFDSDTFAGDRSSFSTQQWSMAYDLALTRPLNERLSMHLGLQGEIYYPLPLPGYGVYGGVSSYYGTPEYGIAPALVVRGATDFGIDSRGGPGSILGAEASASMYFCPEQNVSLGLVPFFGIHRVFSREGASANSIYYGGAVVMSLPLSRQDRLEFSGGTGRVKSSGEASWNAPIIGTRWGR
jgi:hypothetical protein